ncbi:HD domain-containing phosphohydrolase [Paucidesulfovibrio longus]|uniref:HD domain-containing phosphohydrolase n=1 Tax=Paucidesulfovibrio longus TaxID=889 RepID=UPI001F320CB4|nr:HD domain-containing phosphohydrolase [Paucidesulfovibrio longus]
MDNVCKRPMDIVKNIMSVIEELNHLKDVDTILDRVLFEARHLTRADAGSIFLIQDGQLRFSYVHNDTLFGNNGVNKHVYTDFTVPINDKSIVGYAALTGKTLVIDDAYELDKNLPYSFNRSFDEESGYATRSILTIPLKTLRGAAVGVLQLINARDEEGVVRPFNEDDLKYAPFFANHASVAIERGIMTRELILRMMKMAEMRDPSETGAHVMRVGSYTAELYHKIAQKLGLEEHEIRRTKDLIRLAAMLHDVGKVGIPDAILKKPGRLDKEEFATIQWHTVFGGALFVNTTSELDSLCLDIALHHHERWDGNGYPGVLNDDLARVERLCIQNLAGEDIPLPARICALADVYDALGSVRSYKNAWPEERILALVREERGRHFDPQVVDTFFEIYDTIQAIKSKYQERK